MHIMAPVMVLLSAIFGIGAIGFFTAFLYMGAFHIVDFNISGSALLLLDAGLCLLFGLQHSIMVRPKIKSLIMKFIPSNYFSAFFSVISGIVLSLVILLWQESAIVIITFEGFAYWLVRGAFFIVLFGQFWAIRSLESLDLFGIHTILGTAPPKTDTAEAILMIGAYRWVRHPVYFTTLLLIWLYPHITADRLVFNIIFTIWIVIGAYFEERDLVAVHGDDYINYQNIVPMLIPYRIPK